MLASLGADLGCSFLARPLLLVWLEAKGCTGSVWSPAAACPADVLQPAGTMEPREIGLEIEPPAPLEKPSQRAGRRRGQCLPALGYRSWRLNTSYNVGLGSAGVQVCWGLLRRPEPTQGNGQLRCGQRSEGTGSQLWPTPLGTTAGPQPAPVLREPLATA